MQDVNKILATIAIAYDTLGIKLVRKSEVNDSINFIETVNSLVTIIEIGEYREGIKSLIHLKGKYNSHNTRKILYIYSATEFPFHTWKQIENVISMNKMLMFQHPDIANYGRTFIEFLRTHRLDIPVLSINKVE